MATEDWHSSFPPVEPPWWQKVLIYLVVVGLPLGLVFAILFHTPKP